MTFLTVVENLKIGEIASQLSFQRLMEFGYFGAHFSVTRSKAARAFCQTSDKWSSGPCQMFSGPYQGHILRCFLPSARYSTDIRF